jgi:fucose permease
MSIGSLLVASGAGLQVGGAIGLGIAIVSTFCLIPASLGHAVIAPIKIVFIIVLGVISWAITNL